MTEDFIKWLKNNGHDDVATILINARSKSQMRRFTIQIKELDELWNKYLEEKEK